MTMPDKVQFLCSCPDYLHGTGKRTKKKTTCKQCKGVKLPFAAPLIGGTVRMVSTMPYVLDVAATARRNCVGTVRLPSSSTFLQQNRQQPLRQRSTILCGEHDPYDFLRQSRLMYTNEDQITAESNRLPLFRQQFQTIGPSTVARANRYLPNNTFCSPLIPDFYRNSRSILQTSINPYELVSTTLHNNEFAPSANLYDLITPKIDQNADAGGTISTRNNRSDANKRSCVLETFAKRSSAPQLRPAPPPPITPATSPPPVPALENMPTVVKTITGNLSKRMDVATTNGKAINSTQVVAISTPMASSTVSKYKSILKQPIVASNAHANTSTKEAIVLRKDLVAVAEKSNGKRVQSVNETTNAKESKSVNNGNVKSNTSPRNIAPMKTGLKRIIKESNVAIESPTTTGRSKKVQFHTELVDVKSRRPKSSCSNRSSDEFTAARCKEFDDTDDSLANSKNISDSSSEQLDSIQIATPSNVGKQKFYSKNDLNRSSRSRRKPVQRSLSDRRESDAKDEELNFKDTTALRAKPVRTIPRQLFQKPLSTACRPSSPPPKLPTANTKGARSVPMRPPRQQKNPVTKQPLRDTSTHTTSESNETKGSRIFGLLPVSTINKNKIKIQPFSSADVKSSINRYQGVHNKADTLPIVKKTSISINGGDCMSTVSVSDRVKCYHSSVLIGNSDLVANDKLSQKFNAESELQNAESTTKQNSSEIDLKTNENSANTEGATTEISIVYHNNNSSNCNSSNIRPEVSETIATNSSKTKTLICLDYKNHTTEQSSLENDSLFCSSSPSDAAKAFEFLDGVSSSTSKPFADSFILKLLNDPYLDYLLHGLDIKTIANIIESSLVRLRANKHDISASRLTKDTTEMDKLFFNFLHNIIKEERTKVEKKLNAKRNGRQASPKRGDSFVSRLKGPADYYQNELMLTESSNGLSGSGTIPVRQLYEMLVDSSFWKNGESSSLSSSSDSQGDHQYESICLNCDPIYEEINDKPPPLPLNPPPSNDELKNKHYKSMFLGATKYDILSYLVDAKQRGIVPEESYSFKFLRRPADDCGTLKKIPEDNGKIITIVRNRGGGGVDSSQLGTKSNFSIEENALKQYGGGQRKCVTSVERNDSGVGSETSKTSRNKYQLSSPSIVEHKSIPPIHLCEDCDDPVELDVLETSDIYTPIVCRKCCKKRAERREILAEFFETEEKYSRDLQIIIDEFYQPMLVAGLLTQEQLSAIFLNIEELLENSQAFCEKIRDTFYVALEQGDDDLFTVDIGKVILETSSMLCAFESYCIQQAAASLLLANLEKDKELLRIFLRVSQMENTVLRRMNLNSFLMVPVQRVTKYPLLLARLYKVTPTHLESRERLKEAQDKIECHLNRMNREAKDISTKLWRRLSSNPTLRTTRENDLINIKLRKIAIDLLEWNHDKVHFVVEGKLLITQPTDNNWRKGRTIKLTPVNALLITNELTATSDITGRHVSFPRHSGMKEATLLLVREKSGRYNLYREPLFLDRCVICTESEWAEYFEVHEISSKDSFIFKAEDDARTKHWYSQLQYHAQGTGAWRKRRTALANIMINGMMLRS